MTKESFRDSIGLEISDRKQTSKTYSSISLDKSDAFSSLGQQIHERNVEHNSSAEAQQVTKLLGTRGAIEQYKQTAYKKTAIQEQLMRQKV